VDIEADIEATTVTVAPAMGINSGMRQFGHEQEVPGRRLQQPGLFTDNLLDDEDSTTVTSAPLVGLNRGGRLGQGSGALEQPGGAIIVGDFRGVARRSGGWRPAWRRASSGARRAESRARCARRKPGCMLCCMYVRVPSCD
jgi:hypothetical protein